jgi:hypothetical protein
MAEVVLLLQLLAHLLPVLAVAEVDIEMLVIHPRPPKAVTAVVVLVVSYL